jgi:hypothetical protein
MKKLCGKKAGRLRGLAMTDTVVFLVVLVFFIGVLMPMLARAREEARNDACESNLKGLGKAMLLYANDYDDELPRAGGRNSNWHKVVWDAGTRQRAYDLVNTDGTGGNCTSSSCFYLLVKYAEVGPKTFVCPNEPGVTEFLLAKETTTGGIGELTQAWDFGASPQTHCSYAYQASWGRYALTTSSEPGFPVAADRNPYIASPGQKTPKTFAHPTNPAIVFTGKNGDSASEMYGNSTIHEGEGQNVLFLDSHVTFEKRPFCGLNDDNIYTPSIVADKGDPMGALIPNPPTLAGVTPKNRKDAVLVHDPLTWSAPRR